MVRAPAWCVQQGLCDGHLRMTLLCLFGCLRRSEATIVAYPFRRICYSVDLRSSRGLMAAI